ncbi:hypothetical protein G7046_g5989 [Stylonectria norvegica]|nr:hypothetical protein G7046_g5989 [Stylonectria norvegica]
MAAATYKQFLAAPNSSLLADTASLHYQTTTKSIHGSAEIIKHIHGVQKQITKKKEDILNLVDGGDVIVVEIDTGLGFETGGGPYLPQLDDNFLTARVAYLSITHIVTFNQAGKIAQIRLQWDQGALLKQLEIIGKSGRNWPIWDSREQLVLIQSCLKSAGNAAPSAPTQNEATARTRGNSTNATRDPHASLQLFGHRDDIEAPPASVVSPYGGTRPHQRSFTDILGDEPTDSGSPTGQRQRSMSPSKGGAGKNFQPMRLFDAQQDQLGDSEPPKGQGFIRPNPNKYSHFDFADGSDAQDVATPMKKLSKVVRSQDVRHWDTDKDTIDATPAKAGAKGYKSRREAEGHFEMQDDGERVPQQERPGAKPRGQTHNEGLGLYKNQLFDTDDPTSAQDRALGNITNLKGRGNDFDPHFNMTDDSPANPNAQRSQHAPEHNKAVKMMEANWGSYEQSSAGQKENQPFSGDTEPQTRIQIAGDGMGGRAGTNRDWLYNETNALPQVVPGRRQQAPAAHDDPTQGNARIHIAGDGMGGKAGTNRDWLYNETNALPPNVPGKKQGAAASQNDENKSERIQISGDGMGGRKGTDRDWLYNETNALPHNVPGKKQGAAAPQNDENKSERIQISGDGMGGRKGTDRDWLYNETNALPQAVPGRKPGAAASQNDENKSERIHISGDGMGGKAGTNRDWLYSEHDASEQPAQAPSRKQGATASHNDENKNERIHIAGDGMGGKKGTNRDWLYSENVAPDEPKQAPGRKQNAPTTGQKDFWDF